MPWASFIDSLPRVVGRIDKLSHRGLNYIHRVAGKVNSIFKQTRHVGKKLMKIPAIRTAYNIAKEAVPQINQAEKLFDTADNIQDKIYSGLTKMNRMYNK